jgi:hypothetical protein
VQVKTLFPEVFFSFFKMHLDPAFIAALEGVEIVMESSAVTKATISVRRIPKV